MFKCSCFAGKALFADALLDGTLQGFFKLIEQFRYTTFSYKQLVTYFVQQNAAFDAAILQLGIHTGLFLHAVSQKCRLVS